jgi:hypothetical protein
MRLIRDEEVFSREAPDRDGWLGSQADMSLPRTMPLGLCGLYSVLFASIQYIVSEVEIDTAQDRRFDLVTLVRRYLDSL